MIHLLWSKFAIEGSNTKDVAYQFILTNIGGNWCRSQALNPSLEVRGVWNNYEGNPNGYQDLLGDVLDRHGYNVLISGKTDWFTGAHTLNVRQLCGHPIPPVVVPHFRLYEVVSLHMCVLP